VSHQKSCVRHKDHHHQTLSRRRRIQDGVVVGASASMQRGPSVSVRVANAIAPEKPTGGGTTAPPGTAMSCVVR
jgi:hypothetical protein